MHWSATSTGFLGHHPSQKQAQIFHPQLSALWRFTAVDFTIRFIRAAVAALSAINALALVSLVVRRG